MRYLKFDPVTKIITGYQESTNLDGPGVVEDADGSKYGEYTAAINGGALYEMVSWNGSEVVVGDDPRALFSVDIVTDQPEGPDGEDIILADGVSAATVTITMIDGSGDTVPFNGARLAEFFDGRVALLTYTNGVATKTFKTTKSGVFKINSTQAYRLTGESMITAVEV